MVDYTSLVGSLNIVPDISPHVYQIKVHIVSRINYFMNRESNLSMNRRIHY